MKGGDTNLLDTCYVIVGPSRQAMWCRPRRSLWYKPTRMSTPDFKIENVPPSRELPVRVALIDRSRSQFRSVGKTRVNWPILFDSRQCSCGIKREDTGKRVISK